MPSLAAIRDLTRRDIGLFGAFFLVAALSLGFGLLAEEVMEGDTKTFDLAVLHALRTGGDLSNPIGPPWVEEVGRDVTALGSYVVLGFVFLSVVGYLLMVGKRHLAALMAACVVGGTLLNNALKYGFDRPRPELPHVARVFSPSFPSGHATMATITYLTLGIVLTRATDDPRLRAYLMGLAVLLTVAVGCSRVYLGVHFASDVVAGWCTGAAWALLCWTVALWLQRRHDVERPAERTGPGGHRPA